MPTRTPNVQRQILARLLPLLVLLFVCVLYWFGRNLEGLLISANLENARRSSLGVVYAVEASMLAERTHEVWDRVVENIPRHDETQIEIVDTSGEVVFSTDPGRRGATQQLTDPLCARCHENGSTRATIETTFLRDPDDEDYQMFASPLRNAEGCRDCHSDDPQKLGMVLVRQSLAPIHAQVRTVQTTLAIAGLIALGLTIVTTRFVLSRYLNRPLKWLVAAAKAIGTGDLDQDFDLPVRNELSVLADTLNVSRRKLAKMVRQLEHQRDDFQTLYRLVDQLSRSVLPEERRRRAVELASQMLNSGCVLVRSGYTLAGASGDGVLTLRQGDEIVERSFPDDLEGITLPPYYSSEIVERWQRGEFDDMGEAKADGTVAYPLQRSGQRLGLLLRPWQPYDENSDAAPDPEMVRALSKHLAIALEFSNVQRELVEEERLAVIGETVAGLAHWLKNTLNGLRAGQYVIDRAVDQEDMAKLHKGWRVMKKSIRQVEKLTTDVLYCAKERIPEREPTDPNLIVQEVVEVLKEKADAQGVELGVEPDDGIGEALLDRDSIQRALLNLVTNAIDACAESEAGDLVTIRSRASAEEIVLTVEDNGIGIPEAMRKNLFKRFYSAKGSKGTGLGLIVVKKVAEEHGGSVELESEYGKGSAFHIRIPVE